MSSSSLQDGGVIGGGNDDGHVLIIFGGGADHGGAADVDVFDEVFERGVGAGGGLFELIEVDDDHVDGRDALGFDGREMIGAGAHGEDAAGDSGMERLDAAVQHLRKFSNFADFGDGNAGGGDGFRRAAGGDELDA